MIIKDHTSWKRPQTPEYMPSRLFCSDLHAGIQNQAESIKISPSDLYANNWDCWWYSLSSKADEFCCWYLCKKTDLFCRFSWVTGRHISSSHFYHCLSRAADVGGLACLNYNALIPISYLEQLQWVVSNSPLRIITLFHVVVMANLPHSVRM